MLFRALVRHFVRRLTQPASEDAGEIEFGLGAALALLATPGVFLAIGLLDKYSSLLRWFRGKPVYVDPLPRAFADGYTLLLFSMSVTALVTIWKWDRILPDAVDRLNLGPLPVSQRRVFLASLTAIAMVVGVFILDVNAGSLIVYPMVVMAERMFSEFLRLLIAHLVAVGAGSVFAFCACFSVMGVLMLVIPARVFPAVSVLARAVLAGGVLAMWVTGVGPARWFRAMYYPLSGLEGDAWLAVLALAASIGVALAAYAFGYRRGMEGRLARESRPLRFSLRWGATPIERAAFPFTLRGLWRDEALSLLVVSAVMTSIVVGVRARSWTYVPLYVGYAMTVSVYVAMQSAVLPASNWIFRLLAVGVDDAMYRVARRVICLHVGLLVVLPALFLAPLVALATACLCFILTEALLFDFRAIPFTLRPEGFRNTRVLHMFLGVIGLAIVPWIGAWVSQRPARLAALLAVALAAPLIRRRALEADRTPLVFDTSQPEVVRLGL